MPYSLYEVRPCPHGLMDEAWHSSPFQGPCWVVTTSPTRARFWAAGAFTKSLAEPARATASSPWLMPSLVSVQELEPWAGEDHRQEGVVLVQDRTHPEGWRSLSASMTVRPWVVPSASSAQADCDRQASLCLVISQTLALLGASAPVRRSHPFKAYSDRQARLRITLPGCDLSA